MKALKRYFYCVLSVDLWLIVACMCLSIYDCVNLASICERNVSICENQRHTSCCCSWSEVGSPICFDVSMYMAYLLPVIKLKERSAHIKHTIIFSTIAL